ncbi:CsbD-like [Marinobacter daqiaonensis]|uniref:CsbD-like n=1 Tax=Marinobacter daqiaonensis TaxID=650891 RepID=A0A1I6GZ75_9GAMM|nr:CsbD family protein [Marinobacter daqiaonensis]SFR47387.1 CsbD-like [Marinobacter daqiaonensis]
MKKSEEDKAEGTLDKAKGKVKETTGRLIDDEETEEEGKLDQTKGSGKKAKGELKDAVKSGKK